MKKVYTDNLPKIKSGVNKGKVNWNNSIGYTIRFEYDGISGSLFLKAKDKSNKKKVIISYQEKCYSISKSSLISSRIGNITGTKTGRFKFSIGDVCKTSDNRDFVILTTISKNRNDKKWYECKCLNCEEIFEISEYSIKKGYGCPVCCRAPRKVVSGVNDISTTNPSIAELLLNKDDGKLFTKYSNKFTYWECPNCGDIIRSRFCTVSKQGLYCRRCGDGISYPNKFMYSLLTQLNIKFIPEYSPDWANHKRFDFYFSFKNKEYIIEMDGAWHYKDNKLSGVSKEETVLIDNKKNILAHEHNICMIRINCMKSACNYIKKNIKTSYLRDIFDLSLIDYDLCNTYATSSLVKSISIYKNENPFSTTTSIAELYGISRTTARLYLKRGTELGICNYDPDKESARSKHKKRSPVKQGYII